MNLATSSKPMPHAEWTILVEDEAGTQRIATAIAASLKAGQIVTLSGDLGAGKTAFARALIRNLTGNPLLDVPSPTFTLMQFYDGISFPIAHADFYRVNSADELDELGFDETLDHALLLVEWAERVGVLEQAERLDIRFALDPERGPQARRITLTGYGHFAEGIARSRRIEDFLEQSGRGGVRRVPVQGDASSRAYERLIWPDGRSEILMIAPQRPDGPPVRAGKSYSAIAHLAESVHAFVAIGKGLQAQGLSAPTILASDLDAGLLLLEDLGMESVIDAERKPIRERYEIAIDALLHLHDETLPDRIPITPSTTYTIPPYDLEAMLIEVELLLDWYAPHIAKTEVSGSMRGHFVRLWREALNFLQTQPKNWVLRDYHSPNLLWLPDREGPKRIGILDFQDALMGPTAYDVVSLAQDARISVDEETELALFARYVLGRRKAQADFDAAAFGHAYALMGAQRATKILGIFARLDQRDGKPAYLKHLPQMTAYLRRNLRHEALSDLSVWYDTYLPALVRD
jgi:N-acetylmuramate 1-kinase